MPADPAPARLIIEPLKLQVRMEDAIRACCGLQLPCILESSYGSGDYARWSFLAGEPIATYIFDPAHGRCPFQGLESERNGRGQVPPGAGGLPLGPGWVGYFAYEAGLFTERLFDRKFRPLPVPLARFDLYDHGAVYDRVDRRWFAAVVEWPRSHRSGRSAQEGIAAVQHWLEQACRSESSPVPRNVPAAVHTWSANLSREQYFRRVERAQEYIRAGDIYQVNLTQRFTARCRGTPLEHYLRLRRESPAPFASFLPREGFAVISASPEQFLDLQGGRVVTRPIKGTRPRTGEPTRDAAMLAELEACEKERAELVMIVDLLRNDLGRVCDYGSVRVVQAGEIEEHPTVFHRVATIEGMLRPGRDWVDLMRAAFPGGSITGAPKIRAMEIIDELEPTPRGVYCGAIGWLGLDGSARLNVAIRTMIQVGEVVHCHAGGAIVADSDPRREHDEVMTKAAAMLRAVDGDRPRPMEQTRDP